ncbi:MAG: hypothetical protein ACREIC_05025 [Limisphaerales bacterium]
MNETFRARWLGWLRARWPLRICWRRDLDTPRRKLAVMRRELLRSIRRQMRRSAAHVTRAAGTTLS